MIEETVTLKNKLGLHVRAAAKIVQTTNEFRSRITLQCGSVEADAKSILGIIELRAGKGTPMHIRAEGEDEKAAVEALRALVDRRFDESS